MHGDKVLFSSRATKGDSWIKFGYKKAFSTILLIMVSLYSALSFGKIIDYNPYSGELINVDNAKLLDSTRFRGFMSPQVSHEEDFYALAHDYHANLVRWQLDAIGDWKQKIEKDTGLTAYNQWLNFKLNELDEVLQSAKKYNIKIAVDLHYPPGGRYVDDHSLVMLYEKRYNDVFIKVWQKIARRYKGNTAIWGYDLVNEPVQNKPVPNGMDYMQTQYHAAKAIRQIDANVPIIIESNNWDIAEAYTSLKPLPLKHLIYEAHMYDPHTYTHQGIENQLNINYPGVINGKLYNKDTLRKLLQPLRNFQLANHAHIYIGEFSVVRWAPGAAQYLNDCISIFEEYGWDWTYHAFREADVWNIEDENWPSGQRKEAVKVAEHNTDRKNVLLSWFRLNKEPLEQ